MEPYEYQTLYEFESFYWWYRGLHGIILDTLKSVGLANSSHILDAGCGTGQNMVNITSHITARCFGFDLSENAVPFWSKRGLIQICRASINQIPFGPSSFDGVISLDVLECDEVSEEEAYHELWRTVKPGAFIILTVPAYDWLYTPEHHQAVHASRRYTLKRLRQLLHKQPVDVIRMTYLFASVFPAVAAYRLLLRRKLSNQDKPRSELQHLPKLINNLLILVISIERIILRYVDMPFGSSILAVVRKVA